MFFTVWCLLFLNLKNMVITTKLCSVRMSCLLLYQLQRSTCLRIVLRSWVLKGITLLPLPSFLQEATQFTSSGHGSRLHVSVLWSQLCFYEEGSFPLPNQRPPCLIPLSLSQISAPRVSKHNRSVNIKTIICVSKVE